MRQYAPDYRFTPWTRFILCLALSFGLASFLVYAAGEADEDPLADVPAHLQHYRYVEETPLSYVFVNEAGKQGFYDKASGFTQDPVYDEIYDLECTDPQYPILVGKDGFYGYVNRKNGEVVIPLRYEDYYDHSEFVDGYAVVGRRDPSSTREDEMLWVLVNPQGEETLFPQGYSPKSHPCEGVVVIGRDYRECRGWYTLYGLGTVTGEILLEPKYDRLTGFFEGYASMKKDGLWGHIDTQGREVLPPTYELDEETLGPCGHYFENGVAWIVLVDGSEFYIDSRGNIVPPPASGHSAQCDE